MKATNDARDRSRHAGTEDSLRRAAKLDPIKKSGKERHALYHQVDEEEEIEDLFVTRKESILDYFDDGESEEMDEEDDDDQLWEEEIDEEEEE